MDEESPIHKGFTFDGRYLIQHKLAVGSFGQVYAGKDQKEEHGAVVLKLNGSEQVHKIECEILCKLNEKQYLNFPKLFSVGVHKEKPYIIQ